MSAGARSAPAVVAVPVGAAVTVGAAPAVGTSLAVVGDAVSAGTVPVGGATSAAFTVSVPAGAARTGVSVFSSPRCGLSGGVTTSVSVGCVFVSTSVSPVSGSGVRAISVISSHELDGSGRRCAPDIVADSAVTGSVFVSDTGVHGDVADWGVSGGATATTSIFFGGLVVGDSGSIVTTSSTRSYR